MTAHTPTITDIRNAVTRDESDWREAGAQFDRWLATVEAAAEQRGAIKALREYAKQEVWLAMLISNDGEIPAWQAIETAKLLSKDLRIRALNIEQEGDDE